MQVGVTRGGCPALHKLLQVGQPLCPAGPRRKSLRAPGQGRAGHKEVNQVWSSLDQGLHRQGKDMPHAAGLFLTDGPGGPAVLDVAGQQPQDLAEGQVGVADARVGVAVAAGDDQVGVGRLGAPGEFLDQGRLALTGLAGDKHHPALT